MEELPILYSIKVLTSTSRLERINTQRLILPKHIFAKQLNNSETDMEAQQLGDHHYDRMKELKEFDESKAGVKGLSDS